MGLDYTDTLKKIGEFIPLMTPYVSGGLAGAVLTFCLNRRLERKRQARLSVSVSEINYSLPSHQSTFSGLKVSYNDHPYDELRYYQFRVVNVSQKTIPVAPFVFLLPKDAKILDQSIESGPLRLSVCQSTEPRESNGVRFQAEDIKPEDHFQISLLLSSTAAIKWHFRGADEISIIASDSVSDNTEEQDLKDLSVAAAAYVFFGAIPIFSCVARSAAVLLICLILRRMFLRWKTTSRLHRAVEPEFRSIIVNENGRIILNKDDRITLSA